MTTATETQPAINQHAAATKLFFDCGHAELKPLDATEYRRVSVGGQCTACRQAASSSGMTLSNFRVEYHAPRYEDGKCLYDGRCAILADDAEFDGRTVRVFDVPDVDEGQLAAALFACDAMNRYERLIDTIKKLGHNAADGSGICFCEADDRVFGHSQRCGSIRGILATTTSK